MHGNCALLLTDLVDSTALAERLGDEVAANVWSMHDRLARDLLRQWQGHEIDRTDGFLWLFDSVENAVGHAIAYHHGLRVIDPPLLARAGLHYGRVFVRTNSDGDVALGARRTDLDGIALATVARIMSLAMGGQTLLSGSARASLSSDQWRIQSHGHWRLKGLSEPFELFEVGDRDALLTPPPDSVKAYRVARAGGDWVSLRDLPNNLPAERDAFVGRQESLRLLLQHFERGVRLVTLHGIGGIGKTRFALRYARMWLGEYPGGAWFCDLSQTTSADGIVQAVGMALDVPLGKSEPIERLGAAIAGRGPCLVILDNFEQVAPHAERTLGVWLDRAPDARFIVTSRELLRVTGEQALELPPLSLLEGENLFRERIRATGIEGSLSVSDSAAIAPLVEMLDRLPLAIELAAARAQLMPPQVLLQRIGERFRLLTARQGRGDRQVTLRATLDWSWDLLSTAEQSALAQISVFEGGFTLSAAEAVIDLSRSSADTWVGDIVQTLVEKSLIRRAQNHRFEALRSVQEYAAERLASFANNDGDGALSQSAMRRHWTYFSTIPESNATADRCIELNNLIAACQRAAGSSIEHAVGALARAWSALRLTGPFRIALGLAQAIEGANSLTREQHAIVDRVMGGALSLLGEVESALERYRSSYAHALASGDINAQAQVLCQIADLETGRGRHEAARLSLASARSLAEHRDDPLTMVRVLNGEGALYLKQSQLEPALTCYRETLALAESIGDRRWQGGAHGNLGTIAQMQGRLADALTHYSAGLMTARDVGDRQWEGNMRCNVGLLLHELGDDKGARIELDEAVRVARSIGHRRLEATAICNLGIVFEAIGDSESALRYYAEAAEVARELSDPRLEGQFRGYWGLLLARTGRKRDSMACLEHGAALLSGCNDPASLGAIYCQQAIAAALHSETELCFARLKSAEALLSPIGIADESELGRILAEARRLAGYKGTNSALSSRN
jgi:predicted ATPase/class 3 adenylate cyclase